MGVRKKMKLSLKISIWILVIILISGTLSIFTTIYLQRTRNNRDLLAFGAILCNTVYSQLKNDMTDHNPEQLQTTLKSLKENNMINEVEVYSYDLKVAFSANEDQIGKPIRDDQVEEVLETGKQVVRKEKKYTKQELCVLIPVKNEKVCHGCHTSDPFLLGVIEIGINMRSLAKHETRDTQIIVLLLFITCLFILTSVLLFLHRSVIKPLSAISGTIDKFANGKYTDRIRIKSHDELGKLANAFNIMADKVRKNIKELRDANEQFDRSLIRFGKLLACTLDIEKIPDLIINELAVSIKFQEASILIRGEDNKLISMGAKGISSAVLEKYNSDPDVWEEGSLRFAALWSAKHLLVDQSLSINNAPGKQLFSKISFLHQNRDFYIFPLLGTERMVGFLTLAIPPNTNLTEDKIKMTSLICQETAVAIENFTTHEFLKKASITDELTQLYNQRHFFNTLKEEVARSKRYSQAFSLLFLDLDRFKMFNDSYGHRIGNKILIQVGQLIERLTRSSDKVFRYGGDEFALILPETHEDDALMLADRIREEIENTDFSPDERKTDSRLSVSIGIVESDHNSLMNEDDIFKAADDAMHKAKKTGRNKVVVG